MARITGLRGKLKDPKLTILQRHDTENEINDLELSAIPAPAYPQLLIDDFNPQSLAKTMSEQEDYSGAIISDEGGFFDMFTSGNGRKPDLGFVNMTANGESTSVNRVGRGFIDIPKPVLSVMLMVQPSVIDDLAEHRQFRGTGFLSRFLYCNPDSMAGTRRIDDEDTEIDDEIDGRTNYEYSQLIYRLLGIPSAATQEDRTKCHQVRVERRTEAKKLWNGFHNEIEARLAPGGDLRSYQDWAGRLPGQAARLAGLFHLLRHPDVYTASDNAICHEDMLRALAVAQYFIDHAMRTFGEMTIQPDVKAALSIWEWIKRRGLPEVTYRDIARNRSDRTPTEIKDAILALCERGYLRPKRVDRPKGGRPGEPPYEVNLDA